MSYTNEKTEKASVEQREHAPSSVFSSDQNDTNVSTKLANPLEGVPQDRLLEDATLFANDYGLGHLTQEFKKGALLAQNPTSWETNPLFSEEDRVALRREVTHRWAQPFQLYWLVILCSLAAAVQGVSCIPTEVYRRSSVISQMDETVINGAQLFYPSQFGIPQDSGTSGRNQWLLGLVNSAPYVRAPRWFSYVC